MKYSFGAAMAVCLLVFSFHAPAQGEEKPEHMLRDLQRHSVSVEQIEAEFTQEKHIAFLRETLVSTGHFLFTAPRSLVWAYEKPVASALRYEDGRASVFNAQGREEASGGARRAAAVMAENVLLWTNPDPAAIEAAYILEILSSTPPRLRLVPRGLKPESPIRALILTFSPDRSAVESLLLEEAEGDWTRIAFSHTRITRAASAGMP